MKKHQVTVAEIVTAYKERVRIPITCCYGPKESKTLDAYVTVVGFPFIPQYVVTDHNVEMFGTWDLNAAVEYYNKL